MIMPRRDDARDLLFNSDRDFLVKSNSDELVYISLFVCVLVLCCLVLDVEMSCVWFWESI